MITIMFECSEGDIISQEQEIFLLSKTFRLVLGPTQPHQWVLGLFSLCKVAGA
jgi:hypothetical protein